MAETAPILRVLLFAPIDSCTDWGQKLTSEGLRIRSASTRLQALTLWRAEAFDVMLMDGRASELDCACALAQEIREHEGPGHYLPIVALTEASDTTGIAGIAGIHHERCLDVGMDDTLANSASAQQIAAVLAKWADPVDATNGEIWDPMALARSLESNDAVVIHRLMERFMASTESQLALMRQCLREQDHQGLARLAHNVKSAARTVGAMPLGELCQSLEGFCRTCVLDSVPGLLDEVDAAYRGVQSAMRLEMK